MGDRTWVVTATKDIRCDDVDIKTGDRVAAISSMVPPLSLFALMQFHNFEVDEIPIDVDSRPDLEADDDQEQAADPEPVADDQPQPPAPDQPVVTPEPENTSDPVKQYVADGLDEKTAIALWEKNSVAKDDLLKLIAEGFDLIELDAIGAERVKKILAVYKS